MSPGANLVLVASADIALHRHHAATMRTATMRTATMCTAVLTPERTHMHTPALLLGCQARAVAAAAVETRVAFGRIWVAFGRGTADSFRRWGLVSGEIGPIDLVSPSWRYGAALQGLPNAALSCFVVPSRVACHGGRARRTTLLPLSTAPGLASGRLRRPAAGLRTYLYHLISCIRPLR